MQLYQKIVSPAGRVSYQEYTEDLSLNISMTESEVVNAVAGLAVCAIYDFQQLVPRNSFTDNRIKAVRESVLKMFKGTGTFRSDDVIAHVCRVWTKTLAVLDGEVKL